MRALRFTAFIALVAGLLGASAYLWAPLLSPESPRLRLAAPSVRSLVLAPLRIPPLPTGALRRTVPFHVAGSVSVQHARVVPRRPHVHLGITAGRAPVTTSPPTQPTTSTAAPTATTPPVLHRAPPTPTPTPTPTPAPKPALPLPLPHLVVPQPGVHVKPSTPAKSSTPPPTAPPRPTTAPPPPSSGSGSGSGSGSSTPAPATGSTPAPVTPAQDQYETQPVLPPVAAPIAPAQTTPTPPPTQTQTTPTETTPPPTADTRPGWGCGDTNHTHTGPPGGSQPSPCK